MAPSRSARRRSTASARSSPRAGSGARRSCRATGWPRRRCSSREARRCRSRRLSSSIHPPWNRTGSLRRVPRVRTRTRARDDRLRRTGSSTNPWHPRGTKPELSGIRFSESSKTLMGSGRIADDQVVVVVDPETRTRCPADRVGEIWVSGPSVARGYWDRPDLSAETFGAVLADTGEGPLLLHWRPGLSPGWRTLPHRPLERLDDRARAQLLPAGHRADGGTEPPRSISDCVRRGVRRRDRRRGTPGRRAGSRAARPGLGTGRGPRRDPSGRGRGARTGLARRLPAQTREHPQDFQRENLASRPRRRASWRASWTSSASSCRIAR